MPSTCKSKKAFCRGWMQTSRILWIILDLLLIGKGAHDLKILLLGAAAHQSHVVDSPVRNSQESFMMDMRAATCKNVFSGSASLINHVDQRMEKFNKSEITNRTLRKIGDESTASLIELESHFDPSTIRTSVPHEP